MSKFDEFRKDIRIGAREIVKQRLKQSQKSADALVAEHLKDSEEKLARWTKALAKGELTKSEFKLLANNQITLGRMQLRTIKVIGKKQAIEMRDQLRELLVDTAFRVFL